MLLACLAHLLGCHRDEPTANPVAEEATAAPRAVQPYVFLDHLADADRSSNDADRIHAGEIVIRAGYDPVRALFAHANSEVVFHAVTVPARGHLRFGIGIDEAGWRQGGDGAAFSLSVRTSRGEEVVFSRHLQPQTAPADRGWIRADLDLQRYGTQSVDFIFRTDRGEKEDYDWCWWANPVLEDCATCGASRDFSYSQGKATGLTASPRLVVLISIDTLRADALGCYGNRRISTPNLDALAKDGVRFAHAIAQDSWTIPSHASLLASLYPTVSGAKQETPLPDGAVTLAEALGAQGFVSVGIVNTRHLSRKMGFGQGFQEFHEPFLEKGASTTVTMALDAVRRFKGKPLFLFVHLFDVHGPYRSPAADVTPATMGFGLVDGDMRLIRMTHAHDYLQPDTYQSVSQMHAAYESGVPPVDAELGRFFTELKRMGLYDDALLVVVSDHGESFFEHGVHVGHGLFAYDDEVAVPMIFKFPQGLGAGRVIQSIAQLVDVLPTILDALGLPPLATAQGHSLLARVTDDAEEPAGENGLGGPAAYGNISNTGYTDFVRTARWKYIEPLVFDAGGLVSANLQAEPGVAAQLLDRIITGPQLYDLEADPGEQRNVADAYPTILDALRKMAAAQRERDDGHRMRFHLDVTQRKVKLTDAEREVLRRLGYGQ
jgi:arylsulfatase A-like enzyme